MSQPQGAILSCGFGELFLRSGAQIQVPVPALCLPSLSFTSRGLSFSISKMRTVTVIAPGSQASQESRQ